MNIKEFRQEYPQYNHVDDDTLADRIHEKMYPNVPKEEFMSSFLVVNDTPVEFSHVENEETKQTPNRDTEPLSEGLWDRSPSPMERVAKEGPRGLFNTPRAIENAPESAKNLAIDMSKIVTEFPEVVKGIKAIAVGTYNTAMDGKVDPLIAEIGKAIYDKYGDFSKFKETFETDPATTTVDVLGAMGLLGMAAKGAGAVTRLPGISDVGNTLIKTSSAGDIPTQVAKVVGKAAEPVSRGIMSGVTKFGTTVNKKTRNKLIDTMFKYNILPNEAGLNKTWDIISKHSDEVDRIISDATSSGVTIPKKELFSKMRETVKRAWNEGGMPVDDRENVRKVIRQWNERLKGVDEITPEQAQAFKQGIYKSVKYSDSKVGQAKPMYTDIAKKDLAKSLKESLENINEDLKYINADEGELLELVEPLMKTVNRLENRNGFLQGNMGHTLTGGPMALLGSVAGGTEGAIAGYMLGAIMADPMLRARYARLINKAGKVAEKAETAGQVQNIGQQASRSREYSR